MAEIDSNSTGLNIAEQIDFNNLGGAPVWYALEPNSYSNFGSKINTVARSPIETGRQNKKGGITGIDVSAAFNVDLTKNNLTRLMQGFFYADAIQLASTVALNAAKIVITGATASTKRYAAAAGLTIFSAGQLVLASGFSNASNNGLKTVAAVAAGYVETTEALVDEASPPAAAALEAVGWQFASGDINFGLVSGEARLTSTTTNFTTLGLTLGAPIFIGGDAANTAFANNFGFARIKSISANVLAFDDVTFSPSVESGAGKTIRVFYGDIIKNQKDANLQKRRYYNLERTLGNGATSTQAQYLENALANEIAVKFSEADKINCDLSFVATEETFRSGEIGDQLKAGTRIAAPGEDLYNTSSDLYRVKLQVKSSNSYAPELFAYAKEASISIKNGVSKRSAIGNVNAIGLNLANFTVSGSVTAYFSSVAALQSIRNNADAQFNIIGAAKNAGFVFDIPLLGLGGGELSVQKDDSVTVPLENNAAENANGYTAMYTYFKYLPNLAM